MRRKNLIFYFSSVLVVLAASAYPLYMGIKTFSLFLANGALTASEYPKYIIPYTPVCLAVIAVTLIFPLLYKAAKKHSVWIGSIIGAEAFLIFEFLLERIEIITDYQAMPLESWQYSLCIATPEVLQAIGTPIYAENNPLFKVHFYLIAIIIVLTAVGLLYGFTHMIRERDYSRKKPLVTQLVCTVSFIGLCVLACFTAFYRNGTINISPLSAVLTSLFFIVFGVTFGVFFGSLFYGKKRTVSCVMPSITALITTTVMYWGELVLMGGKLFTLGEGWFFEPVFGLPFALCDFLVMILSGAVTYGVLALINRVSRRTGEST